MVYLLFHSRHILETAFQEKYLNEIIGTRIDKLQIFGKPKLKSEKVEHIIFAITSANQSNSRYNPLPLYYRAMSVDRFAKSLKSNKIKSTIIPIPHFNPTEKYVDILKKDIFESCGIELSPENTLVLSSTPKLIDLYNKAGFSILTGEYDNDGKEYKELTPNSIVENLSKTDDWQSDDSFKQSLSRSTLELWQDYPEIPSTIKNIWKEPLLNDSGSLTDTRNYSTYALGMGHQKLLDLKYNDIKHTILSGRIVDEGCADGALMTKISQDFPDSDLIGIEITSEFMARALERQRALEFGGSFVFFHQRNLLNKIFEDNSIDTTICNSTTHEIWSYGDRLVSLENYANLKYAQTKVGGRLVIRDVVGPENKDMEIYMHLVDNDGSNEYTFHNPENKKEYQEYIKTLSTRARFYIFAEYYLSDMRKNGKRGDDTKIIYKEIKIDGKHYFIIRLKDAVEFMTKKDYLDNFFSELNEEFAFFSFNDWKKLLTKTGFKVLENPNSPDTLSHVYTNSWIVENRFQGKVELYTMRAGSLIPHPYPPTNMILVAEK